MHYNTKKSFNWRKFLMPLLKRKTYNYVCDRTKFKNYGNI